MNSNPFARRSPPVANDEEVLLVQMNSRGGWSIHFADEPESAWVGNYATAALAERCARDCCEQVQVVTADQLIA